MLRVLLTFILLLCTSVAQAKEQRPSDAYLLEQLKQFLGAEATVRHDEVAHGGRFVRKTLRKWKLQQNAIASSAAAHNSKRPSSKTIIRKLSRSGWQLKRIAGDHHQFAHQKHQGLVTVPHPRKDLPIKTIRSIERQAGWRR